MKTQTRRSTLIPILGAVLLPLTGCGDDRPVAGPPPGSDGQGYSAPASAASAPDSQASPSADPLPSGPGALPTADPLLQNDPLSHRDPLASGDPLEGRVMPTEHSHWLSTETNNARVSILLNGIGLSSYQPSGTQDITMKLNRGVNTLTVVYTPHDARSWGAVLVTEGEHQGQAVPLASFSRGPLSSSAVSDDSAALKPITQSFSFVAK